MPNVSMKQEEIEVILSALQTLARSKTHTANTKRVIRNVFDKLAKYSVSASVVSGYEKIFG